MGRDGTAMSGIAPGFLRRTPETLGISFGLGKFLGWIDCFVAAVCFDVVGRSQDRWLQDGLHGARSRSGTDVGQAPGAVIGDVAVRRALKTEERGRLRFSYAASGVADVALE